MPRPSVQFVLQERSNFAMLGMRMDRYASLPTLTLWQQDLVRWLQLFFSLILSLTRHAMMQMALDSQDPLKRPVYASVSSRYLRSVSDLEKSRVEHPDSSGECLDRKMKKAIVEQSLGRERHQLGTL